MNDVTVDVLVIGAGPSGAVAAAYLNQNTMSVKVVEKSLFPRFVIGESLLPRCMDHLEEVGFLPILKQQGYQVKTGARFLRGNTVCQFDFSDKFSEGYDWTWQLPREDFDNVLAQELIKRGVDISFGQEVIDVRFLKDGASQTIIKEADGTLYTINAKFIIDSSGFGRVLPGILNLEKPSTIPEHSSIFCHVNDVNRPQGEEGTLITFDVIDKDTWFWIIPFSNGQASLGFVGKTDYINSYEGSAEERLKAMIETSEYYAERFKDVAFLFEPKIVENVSKSVTKLYGNGFALTGNSAEFIDPVFSSGVTFATESGLKAAKLITKQLNGERVDWEQDYSNYIMEGVNVFSTYVKEWYSGNLQTIFFSGDMNPDIKKQICSVLAGYVWDQNNPFVKNHSRLVKTVAHIIEMNSHLVQSNDAL